MIRFVRTMSLMAVGLVAVAMAQPASAAYSGSLGLVANGALTGSSLSNSPTITFNFLGVNNSALVGNSFNAFSVIAPGTTFTTSTLTLSNLAAFNLTSNTGAGMFQAIGSDGLGNVSQIVTQNANFLDVFLIGNYSGLTNNTATTPASLRISLNYSGVGGQASAAFSLSVPPAPINSVPEPASLGMVALGLAGVVGVARLRRKSS